MKRLLLRDLKRECKELFIVQVLLLVFPVLLGLVYNMKKLVLFDLANKVFAVPEEVYRLFGLVKGTATGNILFYMNVILMVVNVIYIWYSCSRVGRGLFIYEKNESIYTIVQWHSRKMLLMEKYLWTIVSAVFMYIVMYVIAGVVVVNGSPTEEIGKIFLDEVIAGMWHGIIVIWLLMSLTFITALLSKKSVDSNAAGWAVFWTVGCIALGNLYKVVGILDLVLKNAGKEIAVVGKFVPVLQVLNPVSVLSWLNPYIKFDDWGMKAVISGVIAIICVIGAVIMYEKRGLGKRFT